MELITPPICLPITLTEAKLHLRVDGTDEDTLIQALISGAAEHVQNETGRQLLTATRRESFCLEPGRTTLLRLPFPPFVELVALEDAAAVEALQADGTWAALPESQYRVGAGSDPGQVLLITPNLVCPSIAVENLRITYKCGYGMPEDVPSVLKMSMLMLIAQFYKNREPTVAGSIAELPIGLDRILSLYRVMEVR